MKGKTKVENTHKTAADECDKTCLSFRAS